MRTIRASEIGSFLYCARAWWYQKSGKPSQNQPIMDAGTEFHAAHGRKVAQASLLHVLSWVTFLIVIVAVAVAITLLLIP